MITRALALSIGVALTACGPEPPRVVLAVDDGGQALSDLARLHFVAIECGVEASRIDVELTVDAAKPTSKAVEAAIVPGRPFYAWLRGWQTCIPPDTGCVPAEDADVGECTCVDGAEPQVLVREACSPWLL
ncbi:hypothetical protein L6R52_41065, partial [Myxococcota bacterium]|nr:hypothetical protein [Myxococcota bacterium]